MDPAKHIDAVVASGLAPLLKSHGFAKAGRSFHRRHGDRWQVVNVQASSGNSAAQARFTLNLGLYIPEIEVLAGNAPLAGKPKEYECTLRERIGALMPQARDHWWTLAPDSDPALLAPELADAFAAHGLPWLEGYADLAKVAARLAEAPTILAAAAALAAGDREAAARRIEHMKADRPRATAVADAWAAKHLTA
ncbi:MULTISPECIES: DUF4304 domain-containing protein [Lysobacter]|uniref:DUF4304 domain-containing protein n=1 Tax=Lysobacter firmicutimachus TaxID=1792846 RepID=A0ABU8D254_9GAMM|nr:DUF4304 domain-containing protein [Lysobacter antibioticus]